MGCAVGLHEADMTEIGGKGPKKAAPVLGPAPDVFTLTPINQIVPNLHAD